MSRAKPEISHWGGSFTEDKFGTSDNPRTRDGKYKEAVDKGLNPEEELLAKEKGSESEEGFDSSDLSYVRADEVEKSFEKERQARRNAEEEAGWSPRKIGGKISGSVGRKILEEGHRAQEIHDKEILAEVRDIKGKINLDPNRKKSLKRTDVHKEIPRKSIRAA